MSERPRLHVFIDFDGTITRVDTLQFLTERLGGGPELYRARDLSRDQSYFLFATTRAQLERLLFPLGALPKAEVRALARKYGLGVADKSDSQDICFVPQGRYSNIVERLKPDAAEAGDIVDLDGRRLGRHRGIINYTIGQRRGLGIPGPAPLYVVRLDADTGGSFAADATWNVANPAQWRSSVILPFDVRRSLQVTTWGFTDRYLRHADSLGWTERPL